MSDFQLSSYDKASALWQRLREHLEDRLFEARKRNDDPNLSERDTQVLRGEIRALKYAIRLEADRPIVPANEE